MIKLQFVTLMKRLLHIKINKDVHAIVIRSELDEGVFEVSHFLELFFHESLNVILLRLKSRDSRVFKSVLAS